MKEAQILEMLTTIAKYNHDGNIADLKLILNEQIFSYFNHCNGDRVSYIKPLVTELLPVHEKYNHQNILVKETIIEAIDDYFIGKNIRLKKRLNAIDEKGTLEIEHVNAKKDLEAYRQAGAIRNIDTPPELTLPVVQTSETELGVHAIYNPLKWADPEDENHNPHPEIGNPVFDPRARINSKTPGFTLDPQYGRPLVERETGVNNRNGERKILLEKVGPQKGRPINPIGKTGITGRGLLGKFGPNYGADSLVKHLNLKTGLIEIIVIFRRNEKQWAIPGGMVDPGELASQTACREFTEEAGNIPLGNLMPFIEKLMTWGNLFNPSMSSKLQILHQTLLREKQSLSIAKETQFPMMSSDQSAAMMVIKPIIDRLKEIYEEDFIKVILGSNSAIEVYKGYVDDPRNTDHAWMETNAYAWEIGVSTPLEEDIFHLCESGDDAIKRDMIDPIANRLFSSHSAIAAKMIVGQKSPAALQLAPEQLANFLLQRVAAADLLLNWPPPE